MAKKSPAPALAAVETGAQNPVDITNPVELASTEAASDAASQEPAATDLASDVTTEGDAPVEPASTDVPSDVVSRIDNTSNETAAAANGPRTYTVLSHLSHDLVDYEPGETVELSAANAGPLLGHTVRLADAAD